MVTRSEGTKRDYYEDARQRLGMGPSAIVVGLVRWQAVQERERGREREARALERFAERLMGPPLVQVPIESYAWVVADERRAYFPVFGPNGQVIEWR